jgi:hypothetical protein
MTKIAGSRSGSESGSISQRHGSADPDPDPDAHQNVTDPQYCRWLYRGRAAATICHLYSGAYSEASRDRSLYSAVYREPPGWNSFSR